MGHQVWVTQRIIDLTSQKGCALIQRQVRINWVINDRALMKSMTSIGKMAVSSKGETKIKLFKCLYKC